jgi:hypothetical protein
MNRSSVTSIETGAPPSIAITCTQAGRARDSYRVAPCLAQWQGSVRKQRAAAPLPALYVNCTTF